MRDFYHSIDMLIVVSSSEGTPNPALEAMSCGVLILGTPVGNLLDIESVSYIAPHPDSIEYAMQNASWRREEIRQEMVNSWDWSIKYKAWDNFFRRWL